MAKYENMVKHNRERSSSKIEKAVKLIRKMVNDDEQVVVCTLVKRTGLSRAFFYKNEEVREEMKRAQDMQQGKDFVAPQKVIINKAMDKEIEILKKKMQEKDMEITVLKKEIIKLKNALANRTLKTLKDL